MNKQLAELKVNRSADYYGKVIKALEDAGFIIVEQTETDTDRYYIIAESREDE
jgi:DNA-binding PadR family transcriptional regulator